MRSHFDEVLMSEQQVETTKPVSKNPARNTGRNLTVFSKPTQILSELGFYLQRGYLDTRLKKNIYFSKWYISHECIIIKI